MIEIMDSSFFRNNRERLKQLFTGTAPIVIAGNGLLQRNSDTNFRFRQDSSFWYLTGLNEPDLILVMDKGKEYIIIPDRDESRQAFDGSIEYQEIIKVSGIDQVLEEDAGWRQLQTRLKRVKHVATLGASPTYSKRHGIYSNPARARLIRKLKAKNDSLELLDLRTHLSLMRAIKLPEEIAEIKSAINITETALRNLSQEGWSRFNYEYEVEATITSAFRSINVDHAYQPIIASGKNACTLHYTKNSGKIDKSDLILLDVGAEVNHYASDITRTYAIGEPNKRQKQVYETVMEVQEYAINLLKVGIDLRSYESDVYQFMGEKLRELGLIKTIDRDSVRQYCPHATSHFLGLDVHDVGDYSKPLEAGMVLTVEPGIYIPEESIGVRVEDNILITPGGVDVLSSKAPQLL